MDSKRGREFVEILGKLKKPWSAAQVKAILRARGQCEYCGADLLSSPEAWLSSQWDHVVPPGRGGEHVKCRRKDQSKWQHKEPDEVLERNIAVACWKCNNLKRDELPNGVKDTKLLALDRNQRIAQLRPWVRQLRRDYKVLREFAAFRKLVEGVR